MSGHQTNYTDDTHPNRPKDKRFQTSQDTLPSVDWKIAADKSRLKFPRPDSVQVGLVQFPAKEDPQLNIQRALQLAWQAADDGAEVIAFHEMFMLPWFFDDDVAQYQDFSEDVDSPVWEQFKSLAAEKGVVLVCPFFERGIEGRFYNSALVIDTDGFIVGRYRKHHLPPDNERVHFSVGNEPFLTFPTRKGRIGVYICWDNFFPEGARALALDHADIVFAPSAATDSDAIYKWRLAMQHNAMVNGIPWVRINRTEAPFYCYRSVIGADGGVIFEAMDLERQIDIVSIDYTETDEIRREWTFLADRRPKLYDILIQTDKVKKYS